MSTTILFYSKKCIHSQKLMNQLYKNQDLYNDIYKVSIEDPQVKIPKTVTSVPTIIIKDKAWIVRFQIHDKKFSKFIVDKASIAINGVSLTVSKVSDNFFEINIIPHSLKLTNLKNLKINDVVNVELDIFSKYIYKYSN